jgi:hypothetical protein
MIEDSQDFVLRQGIKTRLGRVIEGLGDSMTMEDAYRELQSLAHRARPRHLQPGGIVSRSAADIEPLPVEWLWDQLFPQGTISMLYGPRSLGKSLLTIEMASRVSRGEVWPDGAPCAQGRVGILSAEDSPERTIVPRLIAAGADRDWIRIVSTMPDLADDVGPLEEWIRKEQLRLLVVDPVTAFIGRVDDHKNNQVRSVLYPIEQLADRTRCAILLMSHPRKGTGGSASDRLMGSSAYADAPRAAWMVLRDPEDPVTRHLACAKANLAEDRVPGLSFQIDPGPEVEGQVRPVIRWLPEPLTLSADELCSRLDAMARESEDQRVERSEAVEFLREFLKHGPRAKQELDREAKGAGISTNALRKAAESLRVRKVKSGFRDGWIWSLPQGAPQPASSASSRKTAISREGVEDEGATPSASSRKTGDSPEGDEDEPPGTPLDPPLEEYDFEEDPPPPPDPRRCLSCRGSRFWVGSRGTTPRCGRCHPPAPGLAVSWIEVEGKGAGS